MTYKTLAIVPARSGSLGLPQKNLQLYQGKPLVRHVTDVIEALPEYVWSVVTTDSEEIARASGLSWVCRPGHLSGGTSGDLAVLTHALEVAEERFQMRFERVMMLQPSCPQRTPRQVWKAHCKQFECNYDSVWTVSKCKTHPLKVLEMDSDGELSYYEKHGGSIWCRQQLPTVYERNGVAYVISRKCLLEKKSMTGDYWGSLVIDPAPLSIDTLEELKWAEAQSNLSSPEPPHAGLLSSEKLQALKRLLREGRSAAEAVRSSMPCSELPG